MRLFGWAKGPVSKIVLRIMVGLTAVLYVAFFLIGYDHPFPEDPDFVEPCLTSSLICFMCAVVIIAVAVTVWAAFTSLRKRAGRVKADDGLKSSLITGAVAVLTILMMVVAFGAASTTALSVNGKSYADNIGLRVADMFVFTSLAMMGMAALAAAISSARSYFRRRR